jgi:hypothetical protein
LTENLGLGLTLPLRPLGRALSESGDSSLENHVVVRAGGVIQRNHYFIFRLPLETTRPYFDRTWENVVELARETREAGADFALIVAPRYIHWDPTECPENLEGRMYVGSPEWHFEYIRYFDEAAATADFPVLRLLDAFERTDERPLVFRADSHWNAAGHRVAARAIAEFIVERGLVTDRHGPRENPSSAR